MEEHTTLLALAGTTLLAIIGLFRDTSFLTFLVSIKQKRTPADDILIKELQREQDVTKAFFEMVEDHELIIKYKTLKRVMRTHKKED